MSNGLPEKMDTTMINALITIPDNFKANWKDRLAKLTPILEKTYCSVTLACVSLTLLVSMFV